MSGDPIDAINEALPELHQEIGSSPVVADKTQFCIIGFSDDAEVRDACTRQGAFTLSNEAFVRLLVGRGLRP
jgi:uncharacterized protein YegL